jgi:beta-phosphoglucomutase-like phosphatase (HAD superfamily)
VEAVVFDMDRTLFDSAAAVSAVFIERVVCGGARYEPDDVVAA